MTNNVVPASPPSTVLLLGNYRPTIVLVRSLGSLGYRLIVGLGGGEGGAERSRFANEVWDHPPIEQPRFFLDSLRAFLQQRPDIDLVLPVAEDFVRLLSAARATLPIGRLYAMPGATAVGTTLDKMASYDLAEDAGVPVAPRGVFETYDELLRGCEAVGYPVVIRPIESTRRLGAKKAVVVESRQDLMATLPVWPQAHAALLVQRKVSGRRHNIYFAAQAGRPVRMLEAVIDRTDHPDDTGLAVEGRTVRPSPDLTGYTEALTRALAYTGVGCAQFLVDRGGGGVHFLEVNPRIAGNHAVAEAAGLGLGELAIRLADPALPEVPFVSGQAGLRYAWTYGDLRTLKAAYAAGDASFSQTARNLGRIASTCLRADVHMTWRWDDPLPTLVLYARQLPGWDRLAQIRLRWPFVSPRLPKVGVGS